MSKQEEVQGRSSLDVGEEGSIHSEEVLGKAGGDVTGVEEAKCLQELEVPGGEAEVLVSSEGELERDLEAPILPPVDSQGDLPSRECTVEQDLSKEEVSAYSSPFEVFKKAFEEETEAEARLQLAINFMEAALAQSGAMHFRGFWEARRLCLPLFRDHISAPVRGQLWIKYNELSKEARRLKEILDEQSAFAVEQIEIAIHALEEEIAAFEEQASVSVDLPEFLPFPQALKGHYETYQRVQKQLGILNAEATRINALRKELIRTDMRVRHKNKFFQRLSAAGDRVFPRRKELIKQISHQFVEDVERFIEAQGSAKKSRESFHSLREEIKAWQNLAKVLTLNTHAFTQTRMRLSECWDAMKSDEKERKKERAQQRLVFKQNYAEIGEKIRCLKESLEKGEAAPGEAQKTIEGITTHMRGAELGREEVRSLRDELGGVRVLIQNKLYQEEEERHQREKERDSQKKEKYCLLKEQVEELLQRCDEQEAEELLHGRDLLLEQIHTSPLAKNEKQELERLLKPLRDIITEKKEKAMLNLSDDDRQALQQLQQIFDQRKERRQEIKEQLEALRKLAGSSSLDFEKAMSCTVQIGEEKERLERANQALQEIEQKMTELRTKMKA